MAPSVECDVCRKVYNNLERKPKFLKCFHTFCLSCLESMVNKTGINCPTCSEETIVKAGEALDSVLQTNFYINKHSQTTAEKSTSDKSSDSNPVNKDERYYWCSNCKSVVNGESTCLKNQHDTCDMETNEDIREMAEMSLKMVFVTCKSQLNGTLGKYRTVESDLKASQIAFQSMEQQVNSLRKQNDWQIKKLQRQLSEVSNQLGKASNSNFTVAEMYKLFETYQKVMSDSEDNSKKIGDQLADFESIRNATVSTKIKTKGGEELSAPLFNSASLNFPSEGTSEMESNILTSLSFLIVSCIKNKQWTKPVPHTKPQKEHKQKSSAAVSETAAKEEPTKKGEGKPKKNKAEGDTSKKLNKSTKDNEKNQTATGEKTFSKPQHGSSIPKTPNPHKSDKNLKDKPTNEPKKSRGTNVHPSVPFRRDRVATVENPPLQNVHQVQPFMSTPPPMQPRSLPPFPHGIPPPVSIPSVQHPISTIHPPMQSRNKKAFFVLEVNGKNYGTVVFDLRPDLAPIMCQKFVEYCQNQGGSYQGTVIYQAKPKACIMGGRLPGSESLFMADQSPLKKTRGSIFLRLKRDYAKTQCSIVSSEFCIHLGDSEEFRTTTVFGFVCDGLAVCDAISHMNCSKDHIAISSAGIVG